MIEVSTATRIITPQEANFMGGYGMRTKKHEGVMDELNCNVIALKINGEQIVFAVLDLIMVDDKIVDMILEKVTANSDISEDMVFIAATHTHAGPELRSARLRIFDDYEDDGVVERYEKILSEQVSSAILESLECEFVEVNAEFKTIQIQGVYGNRNDKNDVEDKDLSIVKFVDRQGKNRAIIVNISCHPTVLGAENMLISGDLIGYIAREAEKELGVYPLIMQGAAGDVSNRNYREGHDKAELIRSGGEIAKQMFAAGEYEPLELNKIGIEHYNYYFEYRLDADGIKALREKTHDQMEGEKNYDKHKILFSAVAALDMKLKNLDLVCDFNASIIRLGDIEICAHSGEMFSRFGKMIKSSSVAKLPLIWGYVDDYSGYMVNEEAFQKNYESMMSPFPKGSSEQITRELCAMIAGE